MLIDNGQAHGDIDRRVRTSDDREGEKSLIEATLEGALRLRPILMTSFAFILGCVPLAIASGAGGISRQVMGSTVIGGMLAASFIAIFIIPVTFYVVEKLGHKGDKSPPASGEASRASAANDMGRRRPCRLRHRKPGCAAGFGCMVGPDPHVVGVPAPPAWRLTDQAANDHRPTAPGGASSATRCSLT